VRDVAMTLGLHEASPNFDKEYLPRNSKVTHPSPPLEGQLENQVVLAKRIFQKNLLLGVKAAALLHLPLHARVLAPVPCKGRIT
jgi:hypothetical protein